MSQYTDKELLELAAKAAGVCLHPADKLEHSYGNWGCATYCTVCKKDPSHAYWNPLANDGDALRLAVKLEFSLHRKHGAIGISSPMFEGYVWESFDNEDNDDVIGTTTRRAIVRAAAEIGKEMP